MLLVNNLQKSNDLLKYFKGSYLFSPIEVDFLVNDIGILFLSLRYHLALPEYIYDRVALLNKKYRTQFILLHIDLRSGCDNSILELTSFAIRKNFKLLIANSLEESALYIETIKNTKRIMNYKNLFLESKYDRQINFLKAFPKMNERAAKSILSSKLTLKEILNNEDNIIKNLTDIDKKREENLKFYFEKEI